MQSLNVKPTAAALFDYIDMTVYQVNAPPYKPLDTIHLTYM